MRWLSDTISRPHPAPPRPRETWRGSAAVVLSLLALAACICLATALGLADRLPSTLDRYNPTAAGHSSLYRVTYAGGSQGFLTTNVIKASSDALSYVATYAPGRAIQIHNTYTNWNGTGAVHSRDDYYSRSGERLLQAVQLEDTISTLLTPPVDIWSPEMLAATQAHPVAAATSFSGLRLQYTAWRDPDASYTLPTGQARTALRLEATLTYSGAVVTHTENWFVAGVGLVSSKQTDGRGLAQQTLDLVASTELPTTALPLADLLAGASDQNAFFREDAARSGSHPDARLDPTNLRVTYRLQTGVANSASPLYADGLFYVADTDGRLAALAAGSGVPRWSFSAGGALTAAPAVAGGVVYFGAADKKLYALDAQRGMYLWSTRLNDNIATAPVLSGNLLYVGGEDRTLYALDAATGRVRWRYTTGDRLISSPAVAAGRVIIGSDDSVVYALDAATGHLLWRYALDGPVEATPAISPAGVVLVASQGQQIAALAADSGRVLWTASTRFGYLASPAWSASRAFVASTDGTLHAYDAQTGAAVWTSSPSSHTLYVGSPLVLGSSVLAADTSGQVTLWDAASGAVQTTLAVGASVVGSPTWTGQAVLLTTATGDILTLQSDPGVHSASLSNQWQHEFGGGSGDPLTAGLSSQPFWYHDQPHVVLRGGTVWSLDQQTGQANLLADLGAPIIANPVLSNSTVFIGTQNGSLIAYDLASHRSTWQAAITGSIRFAPALTDGAVYVNAIGAAQTTLTALERASGNILWTRAFTNGNSTPALDGDKLFVAGAAITALDPRSGQVLWQSDPFVALGCLASHNGLVFAGRDLGAGPSFVALAAATGQVLWSHTEPVRFAFARPAFDAANGTVIAGATNGELFAYDTHTGAERWRFQADSAIQSDPQVQAGVVFITAASGNLYALDAANGRLLDNFRPGLPIDTTSAPLVLSDRVLAAHGLTLFSLMLEAR